MKYILICVFSLFINALSVSATIQTPDILIFNGKEYHLQTEILQNYLKEHPEIKIPQREIMTVSSDLWRGYRATFEIAEDQFFLKDIHIESYNTETETSEWESVLNEMFQNQDRVKLDWITGLLIISEEDIYDYGDKNKECNYLLFAIEQGNLMYHQELIFDEYRAFTSLRALRFKEWKNHNYSDDYIDTIKVTTPKNTDQYLDYFVYFSFYNLFR